MPFDFTPKLDIMRPSIPHDDNDAGSEPPFLNKSHIELSKRESELIVEMERLRQENALLRTIVRRPDVLSPEFMYRTMTIDEYFAKNIKGWHWVCWNVDNFDNVGVVLLGA